MTAVDTTSEAASEPDFLVVRNVEEQYSIWPAGRDVPAGWEVIGPPRPKDACLTHIAEVWTDMRPASLRRSMEAAAGEQSS
ncbi:MbtH family NRPS accessory protein [Streptomyces sp. NPDC047071]|uniref:MbtH family protein n=1 Tax=Streptomyces sp. NPDC047071 TaxID=3154808 RepID=UPI0034565D92